MKLKVYFVSEKAVEVSITDRKSGNASARKIMEEGLVINVSGNKTTIYYPPAQIQKVVFER